MIKVNFFRFDQNAFIAGQMIKSQNIKTLDQNGSLYYFDILATKLKEYRVITGIETFVREMSLIEARK